MRVAPREGRQLARLMARDGFTREEAENRLSQPNGHGRKGAPWRTSSSRQTARLKKPAALIPPLYAAELAKEGSHGKHTASQTKCDRYQAQAAPSAQAAQPVTQHPVQPTRGYPPQSNSQNPPSSPVQQAMQPRSAAPRGYQQQTGYYTQLPNQRPPQRPAQMPPVRQAQAPYAGMNAAYSQPQRRTAPRPTQSAVPHRVESVLAETVRRKLPTRIACPFG